MAAKVKKPGQAVDYDNYNTIDDVRPIPHSNPQLVSFSDQFRQTYMQGGICRRGWGGSIHPKELNDPPWLTPQKS